MAALTHQQALTVLTENLRQRVQRVGTCPDRKQLSEAIRLLRIAIERVDAA